MADTSPSEPREIPAGRIAVGTVEAPPSKSHAIRALICAALGDGESRLSFTSGHLPDDVLRTLDALRGLGFPIRTEGSTLTIEGSAGAIPRPAATIDVGSSATALRFLAAVCALGTGPYTITGSPQLLRRPAGAIVPALRLLGVSVKGECGGGEGVRPPLVISGGPPRGREVEVDASASSHAVSALLLVGSVLPHGLRLTPRGRIVSGPYIDLTVETLRRFGASLGGPPGRWFVQRCALRADFRIDGDWWSAAYPLAAAAATDGAVSVDGVSPLNKLGYMPIVRLLHAFGATVSVLAPVVNAFGRVSRPVDVDLSDSPDLAPLVGALGCLVEGTTRVRGAAHLRIKETDRIAAVVRCARALGCRAEEHPDGFEVTGPARHGALIDPEGDHRIAMAFAVAGLAVPGTRIADPGCVAKSYPTFWQDLDSLLGRSP